LLKKKILLRARYVTGTVYCDFLLKSLVTEEEAKHIALDNLSVAKKAGINEWYQHSGRRDMRKFMRYAGQKDSIIYYQASWQIDYKDFRKVHQKTI